MYMYIHVASIVHYYLSILYLHMFKIIKCNYVHVHVQCTSEFLTLMAQDVSPMAHILTIVEPIWCMLQNLSKTLTCTYMYIHVHVHVHVY